MYKVMIADDEKWILTGLKQIIDWESLSLKIIHTATNGEEALQKFSQEPVDIVVTDINMPKLNGLELLKQLKEINNNTKFIILSGYDEFAYAKEAIKIGVEGYVLKPFDETEIEDLLKNCIEKLKNKDIVLDTPKTKALVKLVTGSLNYCENTIGTKILNKEEINTIGNKILNKEVYSLCILKTNQNDMTDREILNIIDYISAYKSNFEIEVFCNNSDEFIILNGWTIYTDEQEILSYYAKLQTLLATDLNIETFIAVGEITSDIWNINKQYNIAKSLLIYQIIKGFDTIATVDLLDKRKNEEVNVDISKLHKFIIEQNKNEASRYIEDIIMNNVKQGNISPDYLYHVCIKIAILLDEVIRDFGIKNMPSIHILRSLIEQIYKADNISILTQLLIQQTREIMDIIGNDNSKYTPIIQQVIGYTHEHYQQDLNLTILAEKYNMNSSYLGRLFLKEVGCTFAQYLNQIKNNKAKELLLNTNMKINDISKSVGYYEISYFYRKFKKYYGVSPAVFREMKKY